MDVYSKKPVNFLKLIYPEQTTVGADHAVCAGFEFAEWRCDGLATHLVEWLPDYALSEDLLSALHHANAYNRLRQAAVRVYSTKNYEKRGEVGEIVGHCICREFFNTIPISPRVYYKSSSNEIIKGFDLVHARFDDDESIEVWFGEAKVYEDRNAAVVDAIKSVRAHIAAGFLKTQKLLLGPQVPKETPHRDKIVKLFEANTSLDELIDKARFPIFVVGNSDAVSSTTADTDVYRQNVMNELNALSTVVEKSKIKTTLSVTLFYLPVLSKAAVVTAFDKKLKGLQS